MVCFEEELDEAERARELVVQRTCISPAVQDPIWVGTAMGQMWRTILDGDSHPFPSTHAPGIIGDDSQITGNDSYNGQNHIHRQPD